MESDPATEYKTTNGGTLMDCDNGLVLRLLPKKIPWKSQSAGERSILKPIQRSSFLMTLIHRRHSSKSLIQIMLIESSWTHWFTLRGCDPTVTNRKSPVKFHHPTTPDGLTQPDWPDLCSWCSLFDESSICSFSLFSSVVLYHYSIFPSSFPSRVSCVYNIFLSV